MDETDTTESGDLGLAMSRSRRERPDKFGRLAALQKLRGLKGTKHKYEVAEITDVYEEVDEREYSRRRRDKMEDDWIVDDDGSGYVEDGREIFDEEDDNDDMFTNKKSSSTRKSKGSSSAASGAKGNIKNMLINMPVKKRKADSDIALDDDELLGDILMDLGTAATKSSTSTTPSTTARSLYKKHRPSTSPSLTVQHQSPINPFAMRPAVVSTTPSTPKQYGSSTAAKQQQDGAPSPAPPASSGKGNTPIMTTPVRNTTKQPRTVLRENAPVTNGNSIPRAKRNLATGGMPLSCNGEKNNVTKNISNDKGLGSEDMKKDVNTTSNNNNGAGKKIETEEDFMNMDFSALDDGEDDAMIEDFLNAEEEKMGKKKNEKEIVKKDEVLGSDSTNRGFLASSIKIKTDEGTGGMDTNWVNTTASGGSDVVVDQIVIPELSLDTSKLPLVTSDGQQVLRMFWLDAFEDQYRQPGTLYLFGKVLIESAKQYVSCCITVRNIQRRVYLLPRQKRVNIKSGEVICDQVNMKDVYDEFNENITKRLGIKEFKSRPVKKNYAFEKVDVPNEADYLEVLYSCSQPAVPSDLCGETFSHVFGHTSSSLETFLLDHKIKGPCWLDVINPQSATPSVSWCKVEAVVTEPKQVRVTPNSASSIIPVPPVTVMTLTLRTTLNPKTHQSEVAAIGCLVQHAFPLDKPPPQQPITQHFCALTKPSLTTWPWDFKSQCPKYRHTKIEKHDTERALLGFLLARLQQVDPDVLVGHDLLGYDLGILLHRLQHNKIPHWSRLGRIKRTVWPKLTTSLSHFTERAAVSGRLLVDTKISSRELIRAKSYELGPLVEQVLKIQAAPLLSGDGEGGAGGEQQMVKKCYDSSESLLHLVSVTMQCSYHVVRLMCELNVLPLALQITNIAGNLLSRTLVGGRSERNEYLLLHAFSERGYIAPDKEHKKLPTSKGDKSKTAAATRKKAAYAGGLVLEPKKGFYDKYILLMDFNSLYPSIIQEYNICFTTVDRQHSPQEDGQLEQGYGSLPEPDQAAGVLPTEIKKLVESRRSVKQLMKGTGVSTEQMAQLDIRQKALKLTANSMYGCLGFNGSRFYAAHLAAMITGKGREILLQTRDLVQRLNYDVIYGDTDSIMINTNCTDYDMVFKLGYKIKSEVNKLYKQLELEVDGVFKYMLLLKKKKYAALTVTKLPNGTLSTERELKGLDIVRRDWSVLASTAGKTVVDNILSDQSADDRVHNIHVYLEGLAARLREGKVELSELVITKQLTKRPEDYPDKAALAHVQVALRLNSSGCKLLRPGDTVPYVICLDGTTNSNSHRAYHPDELSSNSSLTVDTHYYLAHQLHPVVARLCDPIEGSDACHIATSLGLDPSAYKSAPQYQGGGAGGEEGEELAMELPPQERYRGCTRYSVYCTAKDCSTLITLDGVYRDGVGGTKEVCLLSCPNPKCRQPLYSCLTTLTNSLTAQIRQHINRYYCGWLVCEDPGCSNRTKRVPLQFIRGFPICNLCHKGVLIKEYTESQLYKQLCYYDYIFDFQKACQENKDDRIRDDTLRRAYGTLRAEVQRYLNMSAYSQVNLASLFANLYSK